MVCREMNVPALSYQYVPLISDGSTFRVVSILPGRLNEKIECFFLEVPISSQPRYTALSYAWGNPNIAGYAWVHGRSIAIGKNLMDAVYRLRDSEETCSFWIDALCINQQDEQGEKSNQIPLMRDIYSKAQLVTIYLGPQRNGSERVPSLLERIERAYDLSKEVGHEEPISRAVLPANKYDLFDLPGPDDRIWRDFHLLLSRDWFTRIWVIQEVTLAASAELICGQWSISWTSFISVVFKSIALGVSGATDGKKLGSDMPDNRSTSIQQLIFLNSLKPGNLEFVPGKLIDLLHQARIACATKPEDYCYGLMGLARERNDPSLTIDGSLPVQTVYRRYARYFVAQGDGIRVLYNSSGHSIDLPSWIPDWSYRHLPPLRIVPPPHREPLTDPAVAAAFAFSPSIRLYRDNPDILIVRGCLFDRISDLGHIYRSVNIKRQSETSVRGLRDQQAMNRAIIQVANCITELHQFLCQGIELHYPSGEDHETVVWRTMMCNHRRNSSAKAPSVYVEYYRDFLWLAKANDPTWNMPSSTYLDSLTCEEIVQQDPLQLLARGQFVLDVMRRFCASRRRGKTERGYVGQFCSDAQVCDTICIPLGSAVPFVIRPNSNGTYKIIGDCYVHGIMQGEAFNNPNNNVEDLYFS